MIVCDTGPLLAAANADDREHAICLSTLSEAVGQLIVPALIVTEVCFMLAKSGPQAEATFLRALAAEELTVEPLGPTDYARMADLVVQYGTFPLGAADASVIAVAERLRSPPWPRSTTATSGRSSRPTVPRSNSLPASTNWPVTSAERAPRRGGAT